MSLKRSVFLVAVFIIDWSNGVKGQCEKDDVLILKADGTPKTFQSPNFPDRYPSNSYCQWLIEAPDDRYVVKMTTVRLQVEFAPGCIYDSITVYNGKDKATSQVRRFCFGNVTVYTTGRYLLVVFYSDDNAEMQGFKFRYVAVRKTTPTTTTTTVATTTPTTTAEPEESGNSLNKGLLVGGVVGGIAFVIILGIICGRCIGSGGPRQPPAHRPAAFYHSHAPPTPLHVPGDSATISTALHTMVQNNNAVFMVSQAVGAHVPASPYAHITQNGVTNVAFDGSGDASLGISAVGFMGQPIGIPPPSYDETMLVTHPPAVPPTPRHVPAGFPNGPGLVPPPLYAPRDPAVSSTTPLRSSPATAGPTRAAAHTSSSISTQMSIYPQLPEGSEATTPLRTAAPPLLAPADNAVGEGHEGREERGHGFEFSTSSDSSSSPTDSTLLTSPSLTLSDPGSVDQLPTEEADLSDVCVTEQNAEEMTSLAGDSVSSMWPHGSEHTAQSQTSSCPEKAAADFIDTSINTSADLPTANDTTMDANRTQSECSTDRRTTNRPSVNSSQSEILTALHQETGGEVATGSQSDGHTEICPTPDTVQSHVGDDFISPKLADVPQLPCSSAADQMAAPQDADSVGISDQKMASKDIPQPGSSCEETALEACRKPQDTASARTVSQPPTSCDKFTGPFSSTPCLHDNVERSASGSSLPPPPSSYTCGSFDSDNFPLPPSQLTMDTDIHHPPIVTTDIAVPPTDSPLSDHQPTGNTDQGVSPPNDSTSPPVLESPFPVATPPSASSSAAPSAPRPAHPQSLAQEDSSRTTTAESRLFQKAESPSACNEELAHPQREEKEDPGRGGDECSGSHLQATGVEKEDTGHTGIDCPGSLLQTTSSLSCQSSPMLTERQLRSSASDTNVTDQGDISRRETFHRADSQ